ncbi:MAG: hypothetical protein IJS79_03105 [Oscillospiraceae bacterium]|nr:hypothetical protein [Oscillospiraceae bacterium]
MIDMQHRTDLQFFADGAATAAGDPAAGVSAADAGQQTDSSPQTAARRSWAEVREDYRAEFDAEVQSIVQKRLKGAQEKLRRYEQRESAGEAESGERRLARETGERRRALSAALRRSEAASHFSALVGAAEELRRRVPDFDLMRELQGDAFAELTRPGSQVSLEQAYYAVHPDYRLREAEAVARRTAEALSAAVSAGAARPQENGAQAALPYAMSHREMSKGQREALRRRIYAAGAQGGHLPAGG